MAMAQSTITLDTAAAVDELTEAGVPQQQARAHVRLLQARLIDQNFATKNDIEHLRLSTEKQFAEFSGELRTEVATQIGELRTEVATQIGELRTEIASFKGSVKTELAEVRAEITKVHTEIAKQSRNTIMWLYGLHAGTIVLVITAMKVL